jgi:hypothetical protein
MYMYILYIYICIFIYIYVYIYMYTNIHILTTGSISGTSRHCKAEGEPPTGDLEIFPPNYFNNEV